MEALLLTIGLFVLMVLALMLLARGWPRSSRLGGYRARAAGRDGADRPPAQAPEHGEAIREDDDVQWRWDGPDGGSGPRR